MNFLNFIATLNGNKEIAELLINKGININEKNQSGCTPLHLGIF
jgi:ankyrin repeat protein